MFSDFHEQFPDIGDPDSAAASLAYLARQMLANPDMRGDSAKKRCAELLASDQELRGLLNDAHATKDFAALRDSASLSRLRAFRMPALEAITTILHDAKPALREVVRGGRTPILDWVGLDLAPELRPFSTSLGIPTLSKGGEPMLLLHGIGTSVDDKDLYPRLANIFRPGIHTQFFVQHIRFWQNKTAVPKNMFIETNSEDSTKHERDSTEGDTILDNLRALPHPCTEAGPYSILRVLASFPAQVQLEADANIDSSIPPSATINTTILEDVMGKISSADVMDGIVQSSLGKRKPIIVEHPTRSRKRSRPKYRSPIPSEFSPDVTLKFEQQPSKKTRKGSVPRTDEEDDVKAVLL